MLGCAQAVILGLSQVSKAEGPTLLCSVLCLPAHIRYTPTMFLPGCQWAPGRSAW